MHSEGTRHADSELRFASQSWNSLLSGVQPTGPACSSRAMFVQPCSPLSRYVLRGDLPSRRPCWLGFSIG
jgi:hypothetical protein